MLVLKRNLHEKFHIGKDKEITITICALNHCSVSIGIDAPLHIPIVRDNAQKGERDLRQHRTSIHPIKHGYEHTSNS